MDKVKLLIIGAKNENYCAAAEKSGAEVVADYLPEVNTDFDGLIISGGVDVHPKYYNEPIDGSDVIDLKLDEAEFALLSAYVELGKPVLGICRGFQLINIFFGGSLYQDIAETDVHKMENERDKVHKITAAPDSVMGRLYGTEFYVNSSHHQALKVLGEGLRATAYWNDKYIEAFEHKELPVFGYQFHPERMCFDFAREDTVDGSKIFEAFIDCCKKGK